jgi:uncharacterized protein YggE
MNDINNFNEKRIEGPDPINSLASPKQKPITPIKKQGGIDFSFKFAAIILSIFLIVWGVSIVFNLFSQLQGEGEVVTNDSKGTISVSAEASVDALPDTASVVVGLEDSGKVMQDVVNSHNQKIQNIKNYLMQAGILEKDIKTVSFSIEPEYQKQTTDVDLEEYPEGRVVIVGYKIDTEMKISTTDVDNIGNYIQIALDEKANTVSDPTFTVENSEEYVEKAREEAIVKAQNEAIQIAKSLGISLGDIQNYNDYSSFGDYSNSSMISSKEPLSLSSGVNQVTVNVYIDYTVK